MKKPEHRSRLSNKSIVLQKRSFLTASKLRMHNMSTADKSLQTSDDQHFDAISDYSPASSPSPKMRPMFKIRLQKL